MTQASPSRLYQVISNVGRRAKLFDCVQGQRNQSSLQLERTVTRNSSEFTHIYIIFSNSAENERTLTEAKPIRLPAGTGLWERLSDLCDFETAGFSSARGVCESSDLNFEI